MHVLFFLKKSEINDHTFHIKSLENKVQMTANVNRRKEIIKIGV